MSKKKRTYLPPLFTVTKIELEHSIAASSTTISPGGGGTNTQPWITEEETETIEKDWVF